MSRALRTGIVSTSPQGLAQPTRTALEQAVLDLPELQHWFRADTRAGAASRLSFRDLATGDLLSGYGATRMGSGINGKPTAVFDGTIASRILAPWQLTPSYSVIALYRINVMPVAPSLAGLLLDDAQAAQVTPQFAFGPSNVGNHFLLKHAQSGAGASVADTTAQVINTNYITYGSFDGATLQAGIATNARTVANTATLSNAYDGAAHLWIGGVNGAHQFFFSGEIADIIVLNVPVHERAAYAAQADVVLNYLADRSGITLGA